MDASSPWVVAGLLTSEVFCTFIIRMHQFDEENKMSNWNKCKALFTSVLFNSKSPNTKVRRRHKFWQNVNLTTFPLYFQWKIFCFPWINKTETESSFYYYYLTSLSHQQSLAAASFCSINSEQHKSSERRSIKKKLESLGEHIIS